MLGPTFIRPVFLCVKSHLGPETTFLLLSDSCVLFMWSALSDERTGLTFTVQSQNYITTDGQSASLSWCQAPIWGPRPDFYYCQTGVGRPLWRGRVCRLQLLLPSTAQSFSGPSPARLIIFYCLRFETPPTWRARSPYLYPPGIVWSSYTPRHRIPLSSPPTTRRATVEVFELASTRGTN
jgi:hypothetical protein